MATLCLDQGSKRLLEGRSPALATGPAPRVGVVSLRRQWNTAWLAGRHRPAALIFLWLVAAGSAVAMVAVGSQFHHRPALLGLGAALGGSAGNLLDHRRHGAVVDFIKVGRWPTFNLADIGIVAGVVITLWAMGS
jgi:lipoprotein signal peptidase